MQEKLFPNFPYHDLITHTGSTYFEQNKYY